MTTMASFQEIPDVQVSSSGALGVQEQVIVPSLPAVHAFPRCDQQRTVAQVVDVRVPPGPVLANFVEQVVDVPGQVPLGPVSGRIVEQVVDVPVRGQVPQDTLSERIVEQVVDVPVTRVSPTSGYAQQLDTRTPAAWLGAPQEQFEGFVRTFSPEEKVRKSPRSRVR